jgi:nitrogen fixation protein NifZ
VPEAGEDQLLVVAGGPGEIVQVGHHEEANVPIYMVDFGVAVLGCLEEELELLVAAEEATP